MVNKLYRLMDSKFGFDGSVEGRLTLAGLSGLTAENVNIAIEQFDELAEGCDSTRAFFRVLGTKGMLKSEPAIVNGRLRLRYNRYLGNGSGSYCQVSATPNGECTCGNQVWGASFFYHMLRSDLSFDTIGLWYKYFAFMASTQCASEYREYRELFWNRSPLLCELIGSDAIYNLFHIGVDKTDAKAYAIHGGNNKYDAEESVFAVLYVANDRVGIETNGIPGISIYFPTCLYDEDLEDGECAIGLSDKFTQYLTYMCGRTLLAVCGFDLDCSHDHAFFIDRYSKLSPIRSKLEMEHLRTSDDFYNMCFPALAEEERF